jgi:hypothetical protein
MDIWKLNRAWDRFSFLGGNILAEGLHDWAGRAHLFFNFTLAFALQLRKYKETIRQGIRLVLDTSLCASFLAFLWSASTGLAILVCS